MATPAKTTTPVQTAEPQPTQREEYVAKVRKVGDAYKVSMLEAYRLEAEHFDLTGTNPPKVPKPGKAQVGLVTEEVIEQVKKLMGSYPKGAKGGEFNVILGRCGIVGVKQTGDARTELADMGVITVEEFGAGSGRGNPKLIKLVETNDDK